MSHTITPEEAERFRSEGFLRRAGALDADTVETLRAEWRRLDRKSTRLNSSHYS